MTGSTRNALYFFDCRVRETRMHFYRFREPKLYKFAKKFQYDKIVQRCKANPLVASREAKFQHEYPPNQTALHLVLEPLFLLGIDTKLNQELLDKRHEAAAALLQANPDAATMVCTYGTPPITMVTVDPFASPHDLNMLIDACPKSLLITDLEGRTPLHYACINNRSNLQIMQILLEACPKAAFVQDNLNKTPLHFLAMSVVTTCMGPDWEFLTGKLVAHSVDSPPCTVQVMKLLMETNPQAVSIRDYEQKTPLHHLCSYVEKQPLDDLVSTELVQVMELLVKADHTVATLEDDADCTPIVVIADLCQRMKRDGSEKRQKQRETLKRIIGLVRTRKK